MANNKIKVGVQFDVDQSGVKNLQKALQSITSKAQDMSEYGTGNLTKELVSASEAAKKLESILSSSWNEKLQSFNLTDVKKGIEDTFVSVDNLGKALVGAGADGQAAFTAFQQAVARTNIQLVESNKLLDEMAESMANTVKWGITSSIFNTLTGAISKAYNYSKDLNESLNNIRIVTGASTEEMERFAKTANSAAKAIGSNTLGYTDASLIFYQQGLSEEDVQARTEATLKAANVTGQAASAVSEQLTAVWNGYKVEAKEAQLYVDKLAAVAAKTGADLEELSTGMGKVASAANAMGVDIDQLNAQLATVVTVTRQAPESVGTAFKTIYARLGDLDISGITDDGVKLGEVAAQLGQAGINVLDAKGELRDVGTIIEEVAGKWNTWNSAQRQAVAIAMAGTRQYNNLLALFENWDMYTAALETSTEAVGTLNEQNAIYLESTEAKLKQLKVEAERTYDVLFDDNITNAFADSLRVVLGLFNDLIEGIGGGAFALTNLGLVAANVFNKQIGRGLVNLSEKRQIKKDNKSGAAFKELVTSLDPMDALRQQEIAEKQAELKTLQKEIRAAEKRATTEDKKATRAEKQEERRTDVSHPIDAGATIEATFKEDDDDIDEEVPRKLKASKAVKEILTDPTVLRQGADQAQKELETKQSKEKQLSKEILGLEQQREEALKKRDPIVQAELDNTQKILAVREGLTDEELKELTANETQLATLQKQKKALEENLALLLQDKKLDITENTSLAQIQALQKVEEESLDGLLSRKSILEEITEEDKLQLKTEEDKANVLDQIKAISNGIVLNEDQSTKLSEVQEKIAKGQQLTEEDTKLILDLQEQALFEQGVRLDKINNGVAARKQKEAGVLDELNNEINSINQNREAALKHAEAVKQAAKTTSIISGTLQGMTSIIGSIVAATNESVTAADKLNAGWQGTTGAASAVANMIAPGSGIIVSGVMELGKGILEVTGVWDAWVDSIKTTEEKLADINKELEETKQKTAEIEQQNTSIIASSNADKRTETELLKIESRFKYLQGLAEKGLLTDDLRGEYESYLDRIQAYNKDILVSYDAQGNRIAANTNLIQDAIKEQRKLNEEALKTTFSSDNFTKWKENQNTTQATLQKNQTTEETKAKENYGSSLKQFLTMRNSGAYAINEVGHIMGLSTNNMGEEKARNIISQALVSASPEQTKEYFAKLESSNSQEAKDFLSQLNKEEFEKVLAEQQEKYRNSIEVSKLANQFTPDWDGFVQYLMYDPNLNNIVEKAEKAGIENVDQFYSAYLEGLKKPPKKKDGTIDYDAVVEQVKKTLSNLTLAFENVDGFKDAFDSLKNIDKDKYDSSTAYHKALEEYLSNLLKTIKSQDELDKYLPAIKAALGDTFTSMTVSFDEAAGEARIGKAGSSSNFTTTGEKVARGFAQSWTNGVEAGFMKIGDWELDLGYGYDMTASLEKMMQDIFPENLLESLDYATVNDFILQFEEQIKNGETTVIEVLQQYKAKLQKSVDEYKTFEQEVARDWIDFQKNTIDPIYGKSAEKDPSRNIRSGLGTLATYIGRADTKDASGNVVTEGFTGSFDTAYKALENVEKTFNNEAYNPTAADNESRREALNTLMTEMENIKDVADDVQQSYVAAFEKIGETIQEQFNVYDKISGNLQHQQRVTELLYKDDPGKKSIVLNQQVQNAANRSEFARMNMNFYKQEYEALANLAESERSATWEEDVKRAKQAYMESATAWQSETEAAVQAAQDKYINAIDTIFAEFKSFTDFDEAINGKVVGVGEDASFQGGWGDILAEDEKYLDAIETAYEKNAITMKYNLALNEANASVQAKIKEAMEEQNALFAKRDKLTKTDIERANLKYDLTMKQIALEEARDNATQLRLQRDAQGNMNFAFVADQDEIARREQEVADANQALYQLDKEAYKNNLDEFQTLYTEYQNELKNAALLGETERAAAMEEINLKYKDRLTEVLGENTYFNDQLTATITSLYNGADAPFQGMSSSLQNLISALSGEGENSLENTMDALAKSIDGVAFDMQKDLASIYGFTQSEAAKSADEFYSKILNQSQGVATILSGLITDNETVMANITEDWTAAKTYYEEFQEMWKTFISDEGPFKKAETLISTTTGKLSGGISGKITELQQEAEKAVKDAVDAAKTTIDALKSIFGPAEDEDSDSEEDDNTIIGAGDALSNTALNTSTMVETIGDGYISLTNIEGKLDTVIEKLGSSETNNTTSSIFQSPGVGSGIATGLEALKTLPSEYWEDGKSAWGDINDKYYLDTIDGGNRTSESERLIWKLLRPFFDSNVTTFDSGGYTGEWGSDAKLAALHEKEIVLNQTDTANILSAVTAVRDIAGLIQNLQSSIGNRANVNTPSVASFGTPVSNTNNSVAQQVQIEAHFPEATNASQIEQAFTNLINIASQRAYENKI